MIFIGDLLSSRCRYEQENILDSRIAQGVADQIGLFGLHDRILQLESPFEVVENEVLLRSEYGAGLGAVALGQFAELFHGRFDLRNVHVDHGQVRFVGAQSALQFPCLRQEPLKQLEEIIPELIGQVIELLELIFIELQHLLQRRGLVQFWGFKELSLHGGRHKAQKRCQKDSGCGHDTLHFRERPTEGLPPIIHGWT